MPFPVMSLTFLTAVRDLLAPTAVHARQSSSPRKAACGTFENQSMGNARMGSQKAWLSQLLANRHLQAVSAKGVKRAATAYRSAKVTNGNKFDF